MGCNNLLTQLSEVIANPGNSANLGSFGEAVAAVLLHDVLDHAIVSDDATRDKPQGIDLVALNLTEEKIMVVEVKTTGSLKNAGPRMGKTVSTRQMSDDWVAGRTAAASLENVRLEDIADSTVGKMVVHVNVARDTVSCHNVDANGKVDQAASMTIGLSDLARFADAVRDN